jgi:hypothetical protein
MPKRSSKSKKREDYQQIARRVIDTVAPDAEQAKPDDKPEKNPAAVALGRLGGLKGGRARAEKLTKEELTAIARTAAKARWKKQKKSSA